MLDSELSNLFHKLSRQVHIVLISEESLLWLMCRPKGRVITGITLNTER